MADCSVLTAASQLKASRALPSTRVVAEVELAGVKYLGKNFQRFYNPGAWSIEVLIAVAQENLVPLNCLNIVPTGELGKGGHFLARAFDWESTRDDQDNIGVCVS